MSTVPNFLDFTINAVLHPTFIRRRHDFLIKIVPSLLNGIRVTAFAWYSVKIRVIFDVRSERRKVDKKSTPTWKMKHANSVLESFEYFCQISSKSILTILSYTVSKLVRFFETQCSYKWQTMHKTHLYSCASFGLLATTRWFCITFSCFTFSTSTFATSFSLWRHMGMTDIDLLSLHVNLYNQMTVYTTSKWIQSVISDESNCLSCYHIRYMYC